MNMYLEAYNKYFEFKGRARRREYWIFIILNLVIGKTLSFLSFSFGFSSFAFLIFTLITIIPTISVGVRRMHDIDRSGWWILFPLLNLIFFMLDGNQGTNRYGESTKY